MSEGKPALFGIRNSNRDFSKQDSWSKNKFNSSFPASLIAYMDSIGLPCVYLKLDKHGNLAHERITALELFGMDPQDPSLYYSFESTYTPFQPISIGRPPTVDLMLMDAGSSKVLAGYEVKLTTLPDESTHKLTPAEYGCELVVRMPSIHFLACSLARKYAGAQNRLKEYFGRNGFGNASSYMEAAQVNPQLGEIWHRLNSMVLDHTDAQQPLMIQPIWKTNGKTGSLADDCFDVFVWSDMAFTKLFMPDARSAPVDVTLAVNRPTRAMIQLFFMLNEYSLHANFNPVDIFNKLSYTMKNDKAFSVAGRKTNALMACEELTKPRVGKHRLKEIILGGGQNLLSPERRLDALIVSSPELFE
ncbi:MAG: HindVP family restriction endonuclease [Bacteroidetes bacterium]|nr:HindVP family restriction endonuclease [Bacteroidota bacterium]MBS1944108.1 HindVP family restriction endonuclease [Bacteroidota bacterium]